MLRQTMQSKINDIERMPLASMHADITSTCARSTSVGMIQDLCMHAYTYSIHNKLQLCRLRTMHYTRCTTHNTLYSLYYTGRNLRYINTRHATGGAQAHDKVQQRPRPMSTEQVWLRCPLRSQLSWTNRRKVSFTPLVVPITASGGWNASLW